MPVGRGALPPAGNRNSIPNRGGAPNRGGTLTGAANAPRAMPRPNGNVGLGGFNAGRPNAARRGGFQAIGTRPSSGARPQGGLSGGTLPVGQMFNNKGTKGQPVSCTGCGNVLVPTLEDFYKEGGEGPFCQNCWADIRVVHPMYNRSGMPNCLMLYRFPERTFKQVQALVKSTIDAFTAAPPHGMARMPLPNEMDTSLANIKISENCPFCKADVTFSPTSADLQIKGINVP